jgi:glycosyltransferase involved in cell wall biosynthesis
MRSAVSAWRPRNQKVGRHQSSLSGVNNQVQDPPVRVAASGLARPDTGIGVIQRKLYPRLCDASCVLSLMRTRDFGLAPFQRARGVASGLLAAPQGEVLLSLTAPLPLRCGARTVAFVHDLRWRRWRNGAGAVYRAADLRRTMAVADRVVTNSRTTARELAEFAPDDAWKVHVAHLGPGQFDAPMFSEATSGRLLLLGGGQHKRNELAVSSLTAARVPWLSEIVAVGVNTRALELLRNCPYRWTMRERLTSAELAREFQDAQYFMHMGMDEGFGLPYIEALAFGCEVIVMEQPLTRELLGDAAVRLRDGSADEVAAQLASVPSVPPDVRRQTANRYTWDHFAAEIAGHLRSVL